jgi:hypothetical protein
MPGRFEYQLKAFVASSLRRTPFIGYAKSIFFHSGSQKIRESAKLLIPLFPFFSSEPLATPQNKQPWL